MVGKRGVFVEGNNGFERRFGGIKLMEKAFHFKRELHFCFPFLKIIKTELLGFDGDMARFGNVLDFARVAGAKAAHGFATVSWKTVLVIVQGWIATIICCSIFAYCLSFLVGLFF